jgi:Flp pilus assembly pilin Flp
LTGWRDQRGQDLIEYALMAGFVAVAAGAIMPGVAENMHNIFAHVQAVLQGVTYVPNHLVHGGQMNESAITPIRIVCASVAVLFLGVIVLRRKKNPDDERERKAPRVPYGSE